VVAAQQFHGERGHGDGDQPFGREPEECAGDRRQAGPRDADAVDDGEGSQG
jgi:hypothetical protein